MIGGVTIWEIMWTDRLPHLPGVPHLRVNRPLKAERQISGFPTSFQGNKQLFLNLPRSTKQKLWWLILCFLFLVRIQLSTEISSIFTFFTGRKMVIHGRVRLSYSSFAKWIAGRMKSNCPPSPSRQLVLLSYTASECELCHVNGPII